MFAGRIPSRCVHIHEAGAHRGYKKRRAWSSRGLTKGMIEAGYELAARRAAGASVQPAVKCPKCEKLVPPPERLVEHFSGCSGLRSSVLNRPGPMYRMPDGR
jgi:hypothetical protein